MQYVNTAAGLTYSYSAAVKLAAGIFAKQVYMRLRGTRKKDSYAFCGWIPPVLRGPLHFRYLRRRGVRPAQVRAYRLTYFPLHQEPESALLNLSPEFNNSMELIAWVSKSLPADALLVVKENPWSFGIRSKKYYKTLIKIPNVVFAHPEIPSREWIERARVTLTITGTAGFEAVYLKRPVLSFGKHQVINKLPTVRYSTDFFTTRRAVRELLDLEPGDEAFERSRNALHKALWEVSFSLPGYARLYKDTGLHLDIAQRAVQRLHEEYPWIFRA